MVDAVIVSTARTPIGRAVRGVFNLTHGADMGGHVVSHAVKRALVFNPSTPLADAIRIATTLRAPDLVEIAGDHSLPDALRTHAREVLRDVQARQQRPRA